MKKIFLFLIVALMLSSCGDRNFATWKGYNDEWYATFRRDSLGKDPDVLRVDTLASGVMIEVYHDGYGAVPKATKDPVRGGSSSIFVSMDGKLVDGSTFLMKGNAIYSVSELVDGLQQAFTKMHQGSHWKVYVPYEVGYGKKGKKATGVNANFSVPPYSVMIFDIDLLDVENL